MKCEASKSRILDLSHKNDWQLIVMRQKAFCYEISSYSCSKHDEACIFKVLGLLEMVDTMR